MNFAEDLLRHTVIVGSSKTGTTGLFSTVRDGLARSGESTYSLYERHDRRTYEYLDLYAPNRLVVAKLLVTNRSFNWRVAADFQRRVLMVRDPRDTLISAMLFFPSLAVAKGVTERKLDRFTRLVRRKESDPRSISVRELLDEAYTLRSRGVDEPTAYSSRFRRTMAYDNRVESFLVRYESFVDRDLADLEEHLGFELGSDKSDAGHSHIMRTGSYGGWRDWFVPSDVDFFRPLLHDYMSRYGYEDTWDLAPEPAIRSEDASGYVKRSCDTRRQQRALFRDRNVTSEARVALLRAHADVGNADAALQLGRLLLDRSGTSDTGEAVERIEFAASTGSAKAMRLLARCYREGIGVERDRARANFWMRGFRQIREVENLRKRVAEQQPPDNAPTATEKTPRSEQERARARTAPRPSFLHRAGTRAKKSLRRLRPRLRPGPVGSER